MRMRVNGTVKVKKKAGCLTRLLQLFVVFIILVVIAGMNSDKTNTSSNNVTVSPKNTVKATENPTASPANVQTEDSSAEPTTEPFTILLTYPELGEYGQYYTFNENVKKAEESDKETIIQCYVPAGNYTLTNEGKYPTYVFIYTKETVISKDGWEEPKDGWVSKILQVGDSCEISIEEGRYINLQENDVFKLVQK